MKMTKRILAAILSLAMLLTLIPVSVAAAPLKPAEFYVANGSSGGSDISGDGSSASPYLTIDKALAEAKAGSYDQLTIYLQSDFYSTNEIVFDGSVYDFSVILASDGTARRVYYTGEHSIGSESGFLKVVNGMELTVSGLALEGSVGAYDARVIYVANGAAVALQYSSVMRGRLNAALTIEGGAGVFVNSGGTFYADDTVFANNITAQGGGALFVADGGRAYVSDSSFHNNTALKGGAIYADRQVTASNGLFLSDVTITNNSAASYGAGMYVAAESGVRIEGTSIIKNNAVGTTSYYDNAYLEVGATMDITGATDTSDIRITCADPHAYRLVSLPDSYTINPAASGDEAGWKEASEINGEDPYWDVRYMVYEGVAGLYLYYPTIDVTFKDVTTLTNISFKDINNIETDFLSNAAAIPAATVTGDTLTVADAVAASDDLVITIGCSDDYRIPTEDIVSVKNAGSEVSFTYVPDFTNGKATLTIAKADIEGLSGTLEIICSAEKWYDLTINLHGPLVNFTTSITGQSVSDFSISGSKSLADTEVIYTVKQGMKPVSGVSVVMYKDEDDSVGGSGVTDALGEAAVTGLEAGKAYYPVFTYHYDIRVISRDLVQFNLSTLSGQELAASEGKTGGVASAATTYDIYTNRASITNLTADGAVTYYVTQGSDVIIFHGNEGSATTAPAAVPAPKAMTASDTTYGTLTDAALVGYTFLGWFDAAIGGSQIDAGTAYDTATSAKELYAHWSANTNTAYKLKYWVEYAADGHNDKYEAGVTETKTHGTKTYYLYETDTFSDGTSDQMKGITALGLSTMVPDTVTYWTIEGFTPEFESGCRVLADGSAAFSVYYNRNAYQLSFDEASLSKGTSVAPASYSAITVYFGRQIGDLLPAPTLAGYSFAGWYNVIGDPASVVVDTTVFNQTGNRTAYADWNTVYTTPFVIKTMTQDLTTDVNGRSIPAGTWTEYKTVYKDNGGNYLQAETDTICSFDVASINSLAIDGFTYSGYDTVKSTADPAASVSYVASSTSASVYINSATQPSATGGVYNTAFDGSVIYLYYTRHGVTAEFPDQNNPGSKLGPDSEIYHEGNFKGNLPENPGKTGYDFTGWVDSDGAPVTEATLTNKYTKAPGTIEILPTWAARAYVLTYVPGTGATFAATDGTGGAADPRVSGGYTDSKYVTYDSVMGAMPSAAKPGYSFDGWFTETSGGMQILPSTMVNAATVVIANAANSYEETAPLYAQWTAHTYTLQFNPGESINHLAGSVAPATMTIHYDDIMSLPTPTLAGYTFTGWVVKDGLVTTKIANGDAWQLVYTDGAAIPVYATWVPATYKYTFDMNDAAGSTAGTLVDTSITYVEVKYDNPYSNAFSVIAVRPGYDFDGWALNPAGPVLTAADLNSVAADATLYAQWTAKDYTVRFHMHGAAADLSALGGIYNAAGDYWDVTVAFDTALGALPAAAKASCTYQGYKVNAPAWTAINNTYVTALPSYTDYQDTFMDGSVTVSGIRLDAKLNAPVTFNPNGGKFADDSTANKVTDQNALAAAGALPVAKMDGKTFEGWFTEADGGTRLTLANIVNSFDPVTVYAHYAMAGGGGGGGGGGASIPKTTVDIAVSGDRGVSFTDGLTNASVSNPGKITVNAGENAKVVVKTIDGYAIEKVMIDGAEVGVQDIYEFYNVTEGHTVTVSAYVVTPPGSRSTLLTSEHIAYIQGRSERLCAPRADITRAEVCAIFYRLLRDDVKAQYSAATDKYSDVAETDWYYEAVATLTDMGIVSGYDNGTFGPNKSITRGELATIAARFSSSSSREKTFSDIGGHWAQKYIEIAATIGWVNGYTDGTYRPNTNITRAETIQLVNNVLGRSSITYKSIKAEKCRQWDDVSENDWFYLAIMEATNAHEYSYTVKKDKKGIENETWLKVK